MEPNYKLSPDYDDSGCHLSTAGTILGNPCILSEKIETRTTFIRSAPGVQYNMIVWGVIKTKCDSVCSAEGGTLVSWVASAFFLGWIRWSISLKLPFLYLLHLGRYVGCNAFILCYPWRWRFDAITGDGGGFQMLLHTVDQEKVHRCKIRWVGGKPKHKDGIGGAPILDHCRSVPWSFFPTPGRLHREAQIVTENVVSGLIWNIICQGRSSNRKPPNFCKGWRWRQSKCLCWLTEGFWPFVSFSSLTAFIILNI